MVAIPKQKHMSRKAIIKRLDDAYSLYIRLKYADGEGMVQCVSCNARLPVRGGKDFKGAQNGHYIKRTFHSTRWLDKNCHPQCYGCNVAMKGNYPNYTIFMEGKYGYGVVQELDAIAHNGVKFPTCQLKDMMEMYEGMNKKTLQSVMWNDTIV